MTANINPFPQNDDMQTHIDNVYAFIDTWLPQEYVDSVKKILTDKASEATIRKVRSDKGRARRRLDVLTALASVAAENKSLLDGINQIINPKNP